MKQYMLVKKDVQCALENKRAVIALESSIIAQGMPYPSNIETALNVEKIAREMDVVPATVGIIEGRLKIGLTDSEIEKLGTTRDVIKVSRKDFSYALAKGLSGGTTVCGTMIAAHMAGIEVFATGGIGGVHREGEQTLDISADLMELASTPIIVISSGAKAVLDLPKTLEFLETHGVPVLGFKTDEFPSFFSRRSGLKLYLKVESASEIARIFAVHKKLQFDSGLLVANPVPEQSELPKKLVDGYVELAMKELKHKGIEGKEVTPFLLSRIVELSNGKSLNTNVELLKNNVTLACRIAASLTERSP